MLTYGSHRSHYETRPCDAIEKAALEAFHERGLSLRYLHPARKLPL